jgi:hypothetical protein
VETLGDGQSITLDAAAAKVFSEKVDGEWKWLDDLITPVYNSLYETSNKMLSSVPIPAEDSGNLLSIPLIHWDLKTPYHQRAEILKTEISDAVGLKVKLGEKEHEILEYKKQVQLKENELRDEKWKEQALEKKIQRAQKNVRFRVQYLTSLGRKTESTIIRGIHKKSRARKSICSTYYSYRDRCMKKH